MARQEFSWAGWRLAAYYVLLNGCVQGALWLALPVGWGYLTASVFGLSLTLGSVRSRAHLTIKRPMGFLRLWGIVAVLFSVQLVSFVMANLVGYAKLMLGVADRGPGMYVYVCLLAPILEELLFRGMLMRCAEPFGKRFAIFSTAAVFGIYHCSLTQSPFAFALGCVLGYVAVEYSLIWAIILHLFNNLVISDWLPRLSEWLLGELADLMVWGTVAVFSVAALVILVCRQNAIAGYLRRNKGSAGGWKCVVCAPGMWVLALTLIGFTLWNILISRLC